MKNNRLLINLKNKKKIWPFILLFLMTLVFFRAVLVVGNGQIAQGWDINAMVHPWESFFVRSITEAQIPFWNPYIFSGMPFLAHPFTAPLYPLNIIYFLFPLNIAFSVYLAVHVFLAGLFIYIFAGKKYGKVPGLTGAVVYAFSGFVAVRIYAGHVQYISAYALLPMVIFTFFRAIERGGRKNLLTAIVSLTLFILNGVHLFIIFVLEFLFLYLIFRILKERKNKKKIVRNLLRFILIVMFAFGLTAVQLIPSYELSVKSVRSGNIGYELVSWGSASVNTLKLFVDPFSLGSPLPENYSYFGPGPNFFEFIYFTGILPLVLIVFYFCYQLLCLTKRQKIDWDFWFFLFAGLVFILISFGKNLLFHRLLFESVFIYKTIRIPVRHLTIVVFIIAVMTAKVFKKIKNNYFRLILFVLVVVELFSFGRQFIRLGYQYPVYFDKELIKFLQEKEGRVLPFYTVSSRFSGSVHFNWGSYYKIEMINGYDPLILSNYRELIDSINKTENSLNYYNASELPLPDLHSKYLDFLNTKYVVVSKESDPLLTKNNKYNLELEGERYRLYQNSQALPRFFLVGEVQEFASDADLKRAIRDEYIDMSQAVALVKNENEKYQNINLDCENEDNRGKVDVIDYSPNRIKLNVEAKCPSIISSSEVYYPGWRAKIDGRSVKILRSNLAFRALVTPQGNHIVEMYYSPRIFYIGGAVSMASILAFIYVLKNYEKWKKKINL